MRVWGLFVLLVALTADTGTSNGVAQQSAEAAPVAPAQGEQVFCVEMNLMAPASSLMALRILLRVWQANRQLDRRAGKKALQLAPATSQVART